MKSIKILSYLLIGWLIGGSIGCAQKVERSDEYYAPLGANTYPVENSYFNYNTAPNSYTSKSSSNKSNSKKRKATSSSSKTTKTAKSSTQLKSLATSSNYIYHTVKSGENLYRIALRYGVSQAAIKSANGLGSNAIRVGQKLRIPGGKSSSQDVAATRQVASTVSTPAKVTISSAAAATCSPAPKWGWPSQGSITQTAASVSKGTAIKITGEAQVLKAAASGTITFIGRGTNYTNRITISHNKAFSTVYEYNGKSSAKIGNSVSLGQTIGQLNAQTPLYFEIRCHKKALNPLNYLPG